MCKTIKQKVKFSASPETIYEFLTDSKKLTAVTGKKASVGKPGSPFSIYKGTVTGIMVDLLPGKRIVQAWRERKFPIGIFSMATINLARTKQGGTELILTHRGVPKEFIPQIEKEWRENYWNKIKNAILDDNA
jgi:activator of HSP90 ATPase